MADNSRTRINWKLTDERNFLVLLGRHLQQEKLTLIPNGFILKTPVAEDTGYSNTYIDMIGIPFRNVYNRIRFRYHRITLTEFKQRFRVVLGTLTAPMRIKWTGDRDAYTESIARVVSLRTGIPRTWFIIEEADYNISPRAYRFKFKIPTTEFTDANNGLSVYNDIDCIFYAEDPRIEIRQGYAKIEESDLVPNISMHQSSSINIRLPDLSTWIYDSSGLIPNHNRLIFKAEEEDVYFDTEDHVSSGHHKRILRFTSSDDVISKYRISSRLLAGNMELRTEVDKAGKEVLLYIEGKHILSSGEFETKYTDGKNKYILDGNLYDYINVNGARNAFGAYSRVINRASEQNASISVFDIKIEKLSKKITIIEDIVQNTRIPSEQNSSILAYGFSTKRIRYKMLLGESAVPNIANTSQNASISITT